MGAYSIAIQQKFTRTILEAWEFCQKWFGVDDGETTRYGYRERCVRLLAEITTASPITISNTWGSRFEKMPARYQATLRYAMAVKEMSDIVARYPEVTRDLLDNDDE